MDRKLPYTAADLVNTLPEKDLADLIFKYGEERLSRRIAGRIVAERNQTYQRDEGTRRNDPKTVPRTRDSFRIHPATRTFQALRIAVNHELESVGALLAGSPGCPQAGRKALCRGLRSLEDRIVKGLSEAGHNRAGALASWRM